jgi:hypothetical protein
MQMFNFEEFNTQEKNPKVFSHALSGRVSELQKVLLARQPVALALATDSTFSETGYCQGQFNFAFLNEEVRIRYPSFIACDHLSTEFPVFLQALFLYYFVTSDGTALTGNWVSFGDLPEGRMYAPAFQGYSGDRVTRVIGSDLEKFHSLSIKAGGTPCEIADAAYTFQALPRVPLVLAYWLGEDEFPSTCKVLFDSASCHYLPIDACAIIGSILVKKALK